MTDWMEIGVSQLHLTRAKKIPTITLPAHPSASKFSRATNAPIRPKKEGHIPSFFTHCQHPNRIPASVISSDLPTPIKHLPVIPQVPASSPLLDSSRGIRLRSQAPTKP